MDRFLRYTTGKEPVITVNVLAAIILGTIVSVTEHYALFAWDEMSLSMAGLVTLAVASWLARRGVFSPDTHYDEVADALYTPPPIDD